MWVGFYHVNTWAQHSAEGPGAALHTWASAAGNQSCSKANQPQHRARSSDFTTWLADYSAHSACCHPKNMRGLLHTSLPGISQEALPAPHHCFFPQMQPSPKASLHGSRRCRSHRQDHNTTNSRVSGQGATLEPVHTAPCWENQSCLLKRWSSSN